MNRRLVEVALPPPLSRQLTYAVPEELTDVVCLGSVVLVPVQQRLVTGFVVGDLVSASGVDAKAIRDISQLIDGALLSPEIVQVCRFLAPLPKITNVEISHIRQRLVDHVGDEAIRFF